MNPAKPRSCRNCQATYYRVKGYRSVFCQTCTGAPGGSRNLSSGLEDPSPSPSAEALCWYCGKPKPSTRTLGSLYCSQTCGSLDHGRKIRQKRISQWLEGTWRGGTDAGLSKSVRAYLLEQCKYACVSCGFNTLHPLDGQTILEIDHINGNGLDHSPENLRVLCPNCHALTTTYRARNMGNGRPTYYTRVRR